MTTCARGYDGDVVRTFRLGWAPDDWDVLAKNLKVSANVLTESGLGFVNRRGRPQDAFRARVIFPIFDSSGKPIALGGRVLPAPVGDAATGAGPVGPKYKNSQDGPIYSKRRTLYGLNWAKRDVIENGEVIVCEGYTDVIAFFVAGMPRAVATCGTALGEEHFRLLRNFARRVVLAYDADAAGAAGANRVYEWERQHQVDVAVAALPAGSDPGELARTDPDALRGAIADAKPFLAFRLARIFEAADLSSIEGRAKTADRALSAVLEHPSELVRDQYLMEVADRCRMEPAVLRARIEGLGTGHRTTQAGDTARPGTGHQAERKSVATATMTRSHTRTGHTGTGARKGGRPGAAASDGARPGLEALRLAVHDPDRISERLERLLFLDELQARAFDALAASEGVSDAIALVEDDDPEVATLLRRLAVEEPAVDADECFVHLVRAAVRRSLVALQAEVRLDPAVGATVGADTGQLARDLELIGTSAEGIEAADRLLAWLHKRETGG